MKTLIWAFLFISTTAMANSNCRIFIQEIPSNEENELKEYMFDKLRATLKANKFILVKDANKARFEIGEYESACANHTKHRCMKSIAEIYLIDKDLSTSYKSVGKDTKGFLLGASETRAFTNALKEIPKCDFNLTNPDGVF